MVRVLNWCYGACAPTVNAELVDEQIRAGHRYKNTLTEIERTRRAAAESLARAMHPPFEAAKVAQDAAEAAVRELYEQLQRLRTRARRRIDPPPELRDAIDAAKHEQQRTRARTKDISRAAYAVINAAIRPYRAVAAAEIVAGVRETEASHKKRVRARYFELILQAGLGAGEPEYKQACLTAREETTAYWGTYVAMEQAAKKNRKGPPPKFKPYTGRGSIAVQLQGGLPVADALDGTNTVLRLYLPELTERMATRGKDSGIQARGEAWLRVGSRADKQPIWCVVPFVYHREIPSDAVIKWAYLDRDKVGLTYTWKLRLVLHTAGVAHVTGSGTAAAHLGFRMMPTGLRIATVRTPTGVSELIMPREEVRKFAQVARLDSIRDSTANVVLTELTAWIDALQPTAENEWLRERTETIPQWKDPERVNKLVVEWRNHRIAEDQRPGTQLPTLHAWATVKLREYTSQSHYRPVRPDNIDTVFGLLEFWRRFDKHMCDWAANASRKCVARRNQWFRIYAKQLSQQCSHLIMAEIDWAELKKRPEPNDPDIIKTHGRRVASIAAPGRLSEILQERFNDHVTIVSCENITCTCNCCGQIHEFDREARITTCSHCGATWDQDYNALANTIARGTMPETAEVVA